MSRRTIAGSAVTCVLVVSLAIGLPGYLSPVPGLVAELKSCIELAADDQPPAADPAPRHEIQMEFAFLQFNATRAGTPLLPDREHPDRVVCGLITDPGRFRTAWQELESQGCVETRSMPQITSACGQIAPVRIGQTMGFATRGGGVVTADFGVALDAAATIAKDGRIHVRLCGSLSDPKDSSRPRADADGNPELAVVDASASLVLWPGQTGIIGGAMRRYRVMEEYRVPLASELPVIGGWCPGRYEAEIDEELVILVTPKFASVP